MDDNEKSAYEQADFIDYVVDLCWNTKLLTFKLLKVSGAYYKGDFNNKCYKESMESVLKLKKIYKNI